MAEWIVCCGMIRSGSTLQYQIAKSIVETTGIGRALGYYKQQDFMNLLKQHADENIWFVVKNHWHFTIPAEYSSDKFRFIYCYRDFRDIAISLMKKEQMTFDFFINAFDFNTPLEQYKKWISEDRIYISRYEKFVEDIKSEVEGIASFLGIQLTQDKISKIALNHSLENQKKYLHKISETNTLDEKYGYQLDGNSLMHTNHINSGKVNQWKNELTSFEIEKLQRKVKPYLIENGYRIHRSVYSIYLIYYLRNALYWINKRGLFHVLKNRYKKSIANRS